MEYSYDPEYFVDLLENVSCIFKLQRITGIENEGLLKLFAYDILSAIKVLNSNGVIHCDIKPQNFLIFKQDDDEDGNVEREGEGDGDEANQNAELSSDGDDKIK